MMAGKLYIVATPIGNLTDITFRAIDTLKSVEVILAEDTRHAKVLLQHYQIDKPVWSLHEHNERIATDKIIQDLQMGKVMALISDAGTPLISDPGFVLVRAARAAGIEVIPIPGACAAITALSVSGLPTDQFYFIGFLPAKQQARCERLQALKDLTATVVCYESTHRIMDALQDILTTLPDRQLVLAKELTKQFEAIITGTAEEILSWLNADANRQKGEFVLLIAGNDAGAGEQSTLVLQQMLAVLAKYLPVKQAAQIAAELTGHKKNALYQMLLELKP
jgi:16S rRNA (cytidine1402-2'-O)-methyltransferase